MCLKNVEEFDMPGVHLAWKELRLSRDRSVDRYFQFGPESVPIPRDVWIKSTRCISFTRDGHNSHSCDAKFSREPLTYRAGFHSYASYYGCMERSEDLVIHPVYVAGVRLRGNPSVYDVECWVSDYLYVPSGLSFREMMSFRPLADFTNVSTYPLGYVGIVGDSK